MSELDGSALLLYTAQGETYNNTRAERTVRGLVDGGRQLGDVDLEARMHILEHLGVLGLGHEGDGQTLGAEAASTSDLKQREMVGWDTHVYYIHGGGTCQRTRACRS